MQELADAGTAQTYICMSDTTQQSLTIFLLNFHTKLYNSSDAVYQKSQETKHKLW